jgi:signal peptidase I
MEAKLFWISMACGAYSWGLRRFLHVEERLKDWRLCAAMHALFWALAGAVGGSLASSYWERPDIAYALMGGLAVLGAVGGFLWRFFRPRDAEVSWRFLNEDLEWADTGFSAILLAAFIMYFFVQAFKIPSGSMRETLREGDHLFVNKLVYGVRIPLTQKRVWRWAPVRRGDVIVFRFPTEDKASSYYDKDFIKRCVAVAGDVVEVRRKKLFVNGKPTDEPYVNVVDDFVLPPPRLFDQPQAFQTHWEKGLVAQVLGESVRDNFGPVTVPPGHYMAMGDNRDRSYDSRFWGPLPDRYLKGRAWVLYFPFKRVKVIR